jgi:glc operon protein GlcG
MHQIESLGLAEAKAIAEAALAAAAKTIGKPECIAIVDPHGMLICYEAMDGCVPFNQLMAIRKASFAAQIGADTSMLSMGFKAMGRLVSDFGPAEATNVPGGLAVRKSDTGPTGPVLGGIGTSGRTADEDDAIARAGLRAIKI